MKSEGSKPAGESKQTEKKEELIGSSTMESTGVLLFDNRAGLLRETTVDGKMKMDMNIMGKKLTQDIIMKMQMSLQPTEAASSPAVEKK